MKGITLVVCLLVALVFVAAHGHHGNTIASNSNNNKHVSNDMCKYTNSNGESFNLHLFDGNYAQLQFYDQSNTKSTVYVQVCGALPSDSWGCGVNSSVCVVSNSMKGTSFGSITNVQRADIKSTQALGKPVSSGVEFMFGNGELCNNGIARKAVVNYICNMDVQDTAYSYPRVTGTVDECTVTITVESPLACPAANYCASIHDGETCKQQSSVCSWSFGRCRASGGCFGSSVEINAGILSFVIVTFAGLCLICVCGLCVCACRRRRCRKSCSRRSTTTVAATKKSSTQGGKKRSAPKPKPEANFDSLPVYQLVPGSSTPINPYTMENIQGYYVMPQHDNL